MKLRKLAGKVLFIMNDYEKGIPLKEIAIKYGVTRQAIWKIFKGRTNHRRRVKEYKKIECANHECRKIFNVPNFRTSKYCSKACYIKMRSHYSILHNTGDVTDRAFRLQARKIMNCSDGQVVHHIDGNVANNDISNLMVFNSQCEHLSYHHSLRTQRT